MESFSISPTLGYNFPLLLPVCRAGVTQDFKMRLPQCVVPLLKPPSCCWRRYLFTTIYIFIYYYLHIYLLLLLLFVYLFQCSSASCSTKFPSVHPANTKYKPRILHLSAQASKKNPSSIYLGSLTAASVIPMLPGNGPVMTTEYLAEEALSSNATFLTGVVREWCLGLNFHLR